MSNLIKKGATGAAVAAIQRALGIEDDGVFGGDTETAVRDFQRRKGLEVDGVVGPDTLAALSLPAATTKRLSLSDIDAAATALGVHPAAVRAIVEVESNGSGFTPAGLPVIQFEPHIMRRQLLAIGRDADLLAQHLPTIIARAPGGYFNQVVEHQHLHLARQIDTACAIESASWGLFQIMGFHWKRLGYESAADFEARMSRSEADQLDAFVRFVLADRLTLEALRARNWTRFAELYNGPAYAKNQYDTKLAAAFARYLKGA